LPPPGDEEKCFSKRRPQKLALNGPVRLRGSDDAVFDGNFTDGVANGFVRKINEFGDVEFFGCFVDGKLHGTCIKTLAGGQWDEFKLPSGLPVFLPNCTLACLSFCPPAQLLYCLPVFLPNCPPAYLSSCPTAFLPACLSAQLPSYLPVFLPNCPSACLF
jgi:hypothetical protein